MKQILLHPGFHKTGTSSMQHFLWQNRPLLEPWFDLVLLRHLKPVVRQTARYSRTRNLLDLVDLVATLDAAFAEAAFAPDRSLLISCEGLSGHVPGWPGVPDYSAMPVLLQYLTGYLAERFPAAGLRVVLTTREAQGWLFSAYRHHLRSHRLTQDWPDFAARNAGAADLGQVVQAVTLAIDPVPVLALPLEDVQMNARGPGGALVDLMGLPPAVCASLMPVGRGNAGPETAMWQEFLTLNRSDLEDDVVAARKAGLAEAVRLGGWKKA
jgi:phosphoribosylcarboxyaminoimidazole (NCAIR) mutase